MKTLSNHTLIYDSDCPMCDLYTRSFIGAGLLDEKGRVMYGCAKVPASFDNRRARDEIALVDYGSGTVTYGIDSLVKVLGHSFPSLAKIARFGPVSLFLRVLYSFISYNRKVIAPPKKFEQRGSCTPTYHFGYRVAYIVFAWLVTSVVLAAYAAKLVPLIPGSSLGREFFICGGQIVFQMIFVRFMTRDRLMHYIGNMMTVSLIGALLLLPMSIIGGLFEVSDPRVYMAWFGMVVTFMTLIHWKRVAKLKISGLTTVTWVVYNALVLFILF
jgi:hypothetical protein